MDTNKFVNRHVGIREEDIPQMLNTIGVNSLDELIDQTIPSDIRLNESLNLAEAMTEREDLKYITDIAPEAAAEMSEKFGKRFFATPKKMGAETAEANINAGLAAANQIVDFFKTGNTRFQVNK